MADKLLRKPDDRSGPALMNREPIVLPEQRKKAARKLRDTLGR